MMIFFYIYYLSLCAAVPNISVSSGSNTTLICELNGTFTLPEWSGPPNLTIYNWQGDRTFTTAAPIVVEKRLDWTNDGLNLAVKSVKQSDSGLYRCYHTNIAHYIFELVVTVPEDTTSHGSTTGMNTASPENTAHPEPKQVTGAAVVGIVTAVVVVVVCALIITHCVWRKRKKLKTKYHRQKPQINQDVPVADTPGVTASEKVPLVDVHSTHAEKSFSAEEWKIVKMLQQDLIVYYRKELSKLQLSPLFEEEGFAADLFDFYVKPNITIRSHQMPEGQSESTPVTLHDIFNCKPCQNIYILSPAGCGKTSFAKYLALIWCQAHVPVESVNQLILNEDIDEMRTFMFLFIVFLRDEHERECDVDIMIQTHLLPNLANSTTYTELGVKFLENLLSNVKCIIILDGLDEWSHPAGNMCELKNKHIPHSRARLLCTTLTTSRPWKLDVVGLKPGEIDKKLELNGLEDDLLTKLIQRVVKLMNTKEKNANLFIQELRHNKLTALSKIPVVVMQLLTLWYDGKQFGKSHCEIYTNMVDFLLERHYKKQYNEYKIENRNVEGCSSDKKISVCIQSSVHCKTHVDLLSKLGKLALNTLFGADQESSLVFNVCVVNKYLSAGELNMCQTVGILTREKVLGKLSEKQSNVSFLHKTFQEFFTALYVTINPGEQMSIVEKIKFHCSSIEKIFEMSQIFMFLSGLCPEVMSQLCEPLRDTVSADSRTRNYRASCELGSCSSEAGTLERVQDTVVEWLVERSSNGDERAIHLPVSDFFIFSPSEWSDELKSLIVQNPVCSLLVCDYKYSPEKIKDILNSVTEFNSIQKLWLEGVSETFVVQLVSQHEHSFRLRPETWRHLECVTLDTVRDDISDDIFYSLVDSILQLPKSVHVRLEDCSISQGTKDCRAYIRSHPRLTVDVDDDDRNRMNVYSLQFHTNKL